MVLDIHDLLVRYNWFVGNENDMSIFHEKCYRAKPEGNSEEDQIDKISDV